MSWIASWGMWGIGRVAMLGSTTRHASMWAAIVSWLQLLVVLILTIDFVK